MDRTERLTYCTICANRVFSPQDGVICRLTNKPADFEVSCPDFSKDEKEVKIIEKQLKASQKEAKKPVRNAIGILIIIGVFYIIMGYFEAFMMDGHALLFGIIDWCVAALFISLGIVAISAPYISLIIGLSLYLILTLAMAVIEPSTLSQGIIWKIVIIYSLIKGIQNSKKIEKKKVKSDDLLDEV